MSEGNALADLLAIQILNVCFSHHINHGKVDVVVDCFSEQASYKDGSLSTRGRTEILEHLSTAVKRGSRQRRYLFTEAWVVLGEDVKATGGSLRVSFTARRLDDGSIFYHQEISDVEDVYKLEPDGRWRIAERVISPVTPDPS
jgi:hypothetical protein